MFKRTDKREAFEYLLSLLIRWYKETTGIDDYSSFTRVKVLKLLFLVSSVKEKEGEENSDLLDVFNNFYAMQYGPVESDIYDMMCSSSFNFFDFSDFHMDIKHKYNLDECSLPMEIKNHILLAVKSLQSKNHDLITYSAFQLVDITHKWNVWRKSIQKAQLLGKLSVPMTSDDIRKSNMFFG